MALRDVLLTLTSYPDPTPVSVVEDAVSFASSLGCHIAAIACETHVQVPGSFLSGSVANVGGIAASEAHKSLKNAQGLLAAFEFDCREGWHTAREGTGAVSDAPGAEHDLWNTQGSAT